ncbi:enoyl-CoA hydratase/isomerase family protein [Actinospongicola halichondriae]|uniref:enoyl-CoA hydratase/isomerase family protein n=1 Tax=Actinospongicola halichondriae TaxID=3236844 RepID=UPI003D570872
MTHEFRCIDLERDGDVLVVTIDHPTSAVNAVDHDLHADLTALFPRLQAERSARAVLLTGRGRAFSAGGDFDWFPQLQDPEALRNLQHDAKSMIWDLLDVHLPVVTAVNGHAMGLGASIALLSDVVFMADSARIGDPHVSVGLVAGDGGTIAWPLALGPMLAKRFLLTGDSVSSAEAVQFGLVHRAVPDDDLHDEALAFAHRLAAGAPLAIQGTKAAVNSWIKATTGPAFDIAMANEMTTFRSTDHPEALAAIAEKRPPAFEGK